MRTIEKEFKGDTGLAADADNDEYQAFLKHVLPEFDEDRVYVSDIKKVIQWYNLLQQHDLLDFSEEVVKSESKTDEEE